MGFSFGVALGSTCNTQICLIGAQIVWVINYVAVPVLFAVAFIIFLYGVFKAYIWKHGEEEVQNAHQLILWGIVGFVVMISVWGLVNIVANTFGLGGEFAPPTPSSVSPYQSQQPPPPPNSI